MNYKRIVELLEDQLRLFAEREKAYLEQISSQSLQLQQQSFQLQQQSLQIESLSAHVEKLTGSISSLEEALLRKNGDIQTLTGKNRGLSKLLSNPSEKIVPKVENQITPPETEQTAPKDRGNNNAKRKEHFELKVIPHDVYPNDPGFDKEKAKIISTVDSIRYEYIPPRFIKHLYHQYNCLFEEKMYFAKAPMAPLQNSSYDASFIAGMLQLRYIYSMPVERIVKFFNESGFELNKATAHGLIKKSAMMMDRLDEVMRTEILGDTYLCMDESYHTILVKEKNEKGKGVRKGYIWAALANEKKLIQYFYQNGSRSGEVLNNYIGKEYKGAIQSDGLVHYKVYETDTYPDIIRLSCFQHCKRKFLDIEGDEDATQVIDLINQLYRKEHLIGKEWSPDKRLRYRKEYAPPILKQIKTKLLEIQSKPTTLPKSPLSMAVNYMLHEYDALCNYIKNADYKLDNNAIELCMRYISLSRKNSLFCGSHAGAKRSALIYSLACSCRLHGINTFEYFTDVLNRMASIKPNASNEVYRELLPNYWKKQA